MAMMMMMMMMTMMMMDDDDDDDDDYDICDCGAACIHLAADVGFSSSCHL